MISSSMSTSGEHCPTEVVLKDFRGNLQLRDRAERAPAPEEQVYGSQAGTSAERSTRYANMDDEIPF